MGTYDRGGRYVDDPRHVKAVRNAEFWRNRSIVLDDKLDRLRQVWEKHTKMSASDFDFTEFLAEMGDAIA